jgi:hypothetical protein
VIKTMSADDTPRPPAGARAAGKRLWAAVVDRYDLEQHELVLLREAVRCVDTLDDLEAQVRRDGLMVPGNTVGTERVHPAAVEARQLRITLARVIAALRMPEHDADRPQRRTGARGVYQLPGVA